MGLGCLHPGCGAFALYRGNCPRHYRRLQQQVKAGKTTWERLVAQGLCKILVRGKDGKLNRGA